MVIISAAICDKLGKILIARQFQKENIRNFPQSIAVNQQHTFVESEFVRYVYMPIDNLYLVLITKQNSNIIEDQETIRLLYKIILDLCQQGVNETNVIANSFEIILAFDDVISLGYRQSISLAQVHNALEMESSEEQLHQMLKKARENEARDNMLKHIEQRQKQAQDGSPNPGNKNSFSSSSNSSSVFHDEPKLTYEESQNQVPEVVYSQPEQNSSVNTSQATNFAPKKGLVLKKAPTTGAATQNQELDSPVTSSNATNTAGLLEETKENSSVQNQANSTSFNPLQSPLEIEIIEQLNVTMTKEGALSNFQVVGDVFLKFLDPNRARAAVTITDEGMPGVQLQPHPNLNKAAWNEKKTISLKDANEQFPLNSKVPTIKYKYASSQITDLPFTFTYWFNGGTLTIEVEYNSSQTRFPKLQSVEFGIKYPATEKPTVTSTENSEYQINPAQHQVQWLVNALSNTHSSCNIEIQFSVGCQQQTLFPITVVFDTPYTFYQIQPSNVVNLNDNSSLNYQCLSKLNTQKFLIN